jgi:hypothetical protein
MKVDQILKVWFLLSPKILISSKYVELKMCMAQIPAALPVHNNPPLIFFQTKNLLKIWSFWKFCIITFRNSEDIRENSF